MTSHLPYELITNSAISSFFYLHMVIIAYHYIGYKRIKSQNREQNLGQFQSKNHNYANIFCELFNKYALFYIFFMLLNILIHAQKTGSIMITIGF